MKRLLLVLFITTISACTPQEESALHVAISPYQDIAMLVNIEPLGLDEKYGLDVELQTMAWEDILPAIASHGTTIDIGFGSLTEFLTKERALNNGVSDPVVFIYPAYIYKGGGFAAMNESVPDLSQDIDTLTARKLLGLRIGAQKNSIYETMLFTLAKRVGISQDSLNIVDISLNDGLLALENGSLDVAAVGLTQRAEIEKQGGRIILTMESLGFADVTGFITTQSTLDERRQDVDTLLRMWFDSVDYVLSDIPAHSTASLEYLRTHAATQYTLESYSTALAQEFFPRNIQQVRNDILAPGSKYDFSRISKEIVAYLLDNNVVSETPMLPTPLPLEPGPTTSK